MMKCEVSSVDMGQEITKPWTGILSPGTQLLASPGAGAGADVRTI